jgi:hypothetical protein
LERQWPSNRFSRLHLALGLRLHLKQPKKLDTAQQDSFWLD